MTDRQQVVKLQDVVLDVVSGIDDALVKDIMSEKVITDLATASIVEFATIMVSLAVAL